MLVRAYSISSYVTELGMNVGMRSVILTRVFTPCTGWILTVTTTDQEVIPYDYYIALNSPENTKVETEVLALVSSVQKLTSYHS